MTTSAISRSAPVARYNRTAMVLHWLVASLLLINIVVGLKGASAEGPGARQIIDLHKSLGLTVLGLVILRILWRLAHKPPPMPRAYPKVERLGAHAAHLALYAVMVLLPLTGYIHDSAWKGAATHPIVLYGLIPFPRIGFIEAMAPAVKENLHSFFYAWHVWLGYALYALVALHLLGVAKHHAIDHEEELQRMLPPGYKRPDAEA
jgi:cytochrome b561